MNVTPLYPNKSIYLSGPMTGYPDFNYPSFDLAAATLREMGYQVFNPAEQFGRDQSLEWEQYMRLDIGAILECDEVCVLDGWEQSVGARLEVAVALSIGLPVRDVMGFEVLNGERRDAVKTLMSVPTATNETILEEAQRLVHGNRGDDYGHPFDDFSKTALIWQAIFGIPVSPEQVALAMVGVKISREVNKPKRDNCVDGAGYFETLSMVKERRAQLSQ
jgi:hypothetical protein